MTARFDLDADAVVALVEDAAREELLPRFRALAEHEVYEKRTDDDPTDIVTAADLAMEARLGGELESLLPGSVLVGEESVAKDPARLALLDGDRPAWVLDPLDGTRNFAAGREDFGVLLALVVDGRARWGFLHQPLVGRTFVAERGAGATLAGQRLRAAPRGRSGEPPEGMIGTRYMPAGLRQSVEERAAAGARRLPSRLCAAAEYASVALGEMDFVLYWRLLPWDHLAGALIVTEAGGAARHPDGREYALHGGPGSLATHEAQRWEDIREALLGPPSRPS